MSETARELRDIAAWLDEGASEHEEGNGAVDLPGRTRTAAGSLRAIARELELAEQTPITAPPITEQETRS